MTAFTQQAADLTPAGLDWLADFNKRGRDRWKVTPFPTRKTESWKYTSLQALADGSYLRWSQARGAELSEQVDAIEGLDACALVFVNGVFAENLSCNKLPESVEIVRFSQANAKQQKVILAKLGSIADSEKHLFAALNDSWLQEGVYLHVAKNAQLKTPIYIHHITTPETENFAVNQRLLLHVETSAEATVVEHFSSTDEAQNCFTNAVTEVQLDANARLTHYHLHLEEENTLHIGGVHVNLERDATLNSFMMSLGANLQRTDVVVNHKGEGAHCGLNGIYLPNHKHTVDFHTCIEHAVPNCTTHEVFRGIIGDHGKAVFNGRIHIHQDAQKTVADLSNKNLLTSHSAEVDTKPELEIYADDVKCSHGATIARLEEKALYYLQSRGVDRERAEIMLSFGFINELLEQLAHIPVRNYLTPLVSELFEKKFDRARAAA
ncbi:Fe-S cluster assembly protein SufD [Litorivivens sp.]|uniref:Fe-S cluster assembly protein SufD n=1 Tax=Litorivivens sp. TaxID=2020868 RepID=UPI0035671D83